MNLIGQLPDRPLDIIGDVHGEIDALRLLLAQLGYSEGGGHPDNRLLVFVGDLVDRGPDSPAVLDLVIKLVEAGHATSLLGNHELNLLLHEERVDNQWWAQLPTSQKQRYLNFLASSPLVLERQEGPTPIRIVHAAWDDDSVTSLTADAVQTETIVGRHNCYKSDIAAHWTKGTADAALWDEEHLRYEENNPGLSDKLPSPGFLDAHAKRDSQFQMRNPVKLVTSGFEVPVPSRIPFKAGHKWRFVERVPWWDDYAGEIPVIVGHYWRYFVRDPNFDPEKMGPDLFVGTDPLGWLGKRQGVYCVDFGVGGRSSNAGLKSHFHLVALRVPEWEIVSDQDGKPQRIGPPNSLDSRELITCSNPSVGIY